MVLNCCSQMFRKRQWATDVANLGAEVKISLKSIHIPAIQILGRARFPSIF